MSMPFKTVNPATGEVVRTFEEISDRDLELVLGTAHKAYETDWRLRPLVERARIVSRAAAILREKAEEYAGYLTLEMGKRIAESHAEVATAAAILDYYAKRAESHLKPKPLPDTPGAEVRTDPIGVILGIEPWNYPYYQIARVAGPQLMVGNVLLLKHAENVPQAALAFARLFEEAGAPAGVYTNIFASIDQVGRVIEDPRVRGVTLTGSERAGASVAERAGRNLKKVVLELGGSDPLIVLDDAPLEWTLDSALTGRMVNTGQCCCGTKRIIVVGKERGETFLGGFVKRMAALKPGDPADRSTSLAPICSERALDNLLGQIELARKNGATVAVGGKRIDRPGFYLEPTVLTNVTEKNPIYTQELFGPVACFYVVKDEREAVRLANAVPYGLGGSVFTADLERGREIASQIESGMVFINQPIRTQAELPFGGVKNSGFGRELSELGFDEFVNKKLTTVAPVGSPPQGHGSGGIG
jgi:succinate-semialdehyde dehydrogenase/glutarate-semialdehyde dehydrogenase